MERGFVEWKKDLDFRALTYELSRQPDPYVDAVRKYGLTTDDAAFLGRLERAFVELD